MKSKAFTLIELLVVIAIIAILAAILFPVFAQAKNSAKKTSSLSQVKQLALGMQIYMNDSDDTFPLAFGIYEGDTTWGWSYGHEVPADWNPTYGWRYVNMNAASWANSTQPYVKNIDLLQGTGLADRNVFNETFPTSGAGVKRFAHVGYAYNGLLHGYPASGVNQVSKLPLVSQANGAVNFMAYAYSNPYLECSNSAQACRYVPSSPSCDGSNGTWSGMFAATDPMRAYGNGINVTFADSSARYQKMGMNVGGRTDYKTDFYSAYNAAGLPAGQWQDTNFCHALLFQPDFDFANWGNPVEWK